MCSPARCARCGKFTLSGCGKHSDYSSAATSLAAWPYRSDMLIAAAARLAALLVT